MRKEDDQPSIAVQAQLALSASDAVAAIANGSLGAVDCMHTLLAQARAQAGLNSLITVNAASALDAARTFADGAPRTRLQRTAAVA